MKITQSELSIIVPQIIDEAGSIPDDLMAQYVSRRTGKECFIEDIRQYFEPTLEEIELEQKLIWESYGE